MSDPLDRKLREVHEMFHQDHAAQRDGLMRQLEAAQLPAEPSCGRRLYFGVRRSSLLALAACVAIAFVAWVAMPQRGAGYAYGQMLQKFDEAQRVYLVIKNQQPPEQDPEVPVGEMRHYARVWYDQQHGVREYVRGRDGWGWMMDNGTHRWQWSPDAPSDVTRSPSENPRGIAAIAMGRILEHETFEKLNVTADSSADRELDGVPLRHYIARPADGKNMRIRVWVDPDGRLRIGAIQTLENERWTDRALVEAKYDFTVPADWFDPPAVRGDDGQ